MTCGTVSHWTDRIFELLAFSTLHVNGQSFILPLRMVQAPDHTVSHVRVKIADMFDVSVLLHTVEVVDEDRLLIP
jgi:hypothetical protein